MGCLSFSLQLAFFDQLLIELAQLAQETIIGPNFSPVPYCCRRHSHIHFMVQHEVSNDHSRGTAVAFSAVNIHFS